ncbi:MAG TPA: hypothetical protein VF647_23365 [Longimicrobium sp.]
MSRDARPELELRRLLWRYEYRALSPLRMKRELRAEYLRTAREFDHLAGGVPAIRRHDPDLLDDRDAFLSRTDAAIKTGRYREAMEHALRGRVVLTTMRALADADARVREAAGAVEHLHGLAGANRLRGLPCLQAPARLLVQARRQMGRRRYGQALYLAGACLVEAAPLAGRERPAPLTRVAELVARFGQIRTLCSGTRELSGDGAGDPLADGSVDVGVALARDGYLAFAERIADELAFLFASRSRFYLELTRSGAGGAEDAGILPGPLNGGADEDTWASATMELWRSRVQTALQRAGSQHERLNRARSSLGPAGSGDLTTNQSSHQEKPR